MKTYAIKFLGLKRSTAIVLAVLMCLSAFSITAFAATSTKNLKDGDFTVTIDKESTAKKVTVDLKTADDGFHDFVSEPYVHNYTALMEGNHGLSAVINLTDKEGNKVDYKGEMTVKYQLPDDWDINNGVKVAWVGTGTWGALLFSSGQITESYISGRILSFTVNYNNTDDNTDYDYPMNSNRVLIVQNLKQSDVSAFSDGVYDVDLAMLSDVKNSSLSMASNTVDRNAKLVVENGKIYLNINFNMGSVMFMPAFANKIYSVDLVNGGNTSAPRYGRNIPGTVISYYDNDEALKFAFDTLKNGAVGAGGANDEEIQEQVDTTVLQNGIKAIHNVTLDVTNSIQSDGTFLIGFCSDIMDSLYNGDYGSDAGYNTTNFLVGNPRKTDEAADQYVKTNTADKSQLEAVFEKYVNACDPGMVLRKVYTEDSYNTYYVPKWQKVYQAYTYVNATQEQIDEAVSEGNESFNKLVPVKEGDGVNLTWNVNRVLKLANAADATLYTSASYNAMMAIVPKADEVLAKGTDAYAYELAEVYFELEDAYDALVLKATDFTALEDAINELKQISLDGYTETTATAFKNELNKAEEMLAAKDCSENEIAEEIKALYSAKEALSTYDVVEDGLYKINLSMVKINRKDPSMAGGAINNIAKLEVVNGEYYLTLDFKGMTITNKFGYLSKLWYYDEGYTYNEYGEPQGKLVEAETLTTQKNADGTDVIDIYNEADNLYPDLVKIKLTKTALSDPDGYVALKVLVPIMESIAEGNGQQNVLAKLEWQSLTKTTEDDPDIQPDKPVEQSPAVDLTDAATGVKLAADNGVFKEGVLLSVSEIANGADFDLASKALNGTSSKFKLYNVNFLDKAGSDVEPNGTVTLSFPVSKDYNSANIALYRINADGTKTVVKGTYADGLYTVVTKAGGSYAVADTTKQEEPTEPTTPSQDNTQPTTAPATEPSTAQDNTQPTTQNSANANTNNTQNTTAANNTSNNNTTEGKAGTVKTGDTSSAMIYFAVMLSACAVLAVVSVKRKGKN